MDKSEKKKEYVSIAGFKFDPYDGQNLEIKVTKLDIWCSTLKIMLPMLGSFVLIGLILALTKTVVWTVFYFILGLSVFTFICGSAAVLLNKNKSYYVVTPLGVVREVTGMTRWAYYYNIKSVKMRKSLFLKDGGTINFKLYEGSGINLQFYMLKGLRQTYDLINYFWKYEDVDTKFDKLFSNDDFGDLLDFVNHGSAQIDKLPNCLQVYYIMWMLYDDMCESGFDSFFIENTEITDKQLLRACELFGLPEITELCKRALALNEKYDIANNEDLPDGCSEELTILSDEFCELDSEYHLEDMFKRYYIDHYEKFDFE